MVLAFGYFCKLEFHSSRLQFHYLQLVFSWECISAALFMWLRIQIRNMHYRKLIRVRPRSKNFLKYPILEFKKLIKSFLEVSQIRVVSIAGNLLAFVAIYTACFQYSPACSTGVWLVCSFQRFEGICDTNSF